VDRLNIVAHDRFREIVDEANKPDSPVRMTTVVLDPAQLAERTESVAAPSRLDVSLGLAPTPTLAGAPVAAPGSLFSDPEEMRVGALASAVIERLAANPSAVPTTRSLSQPEIQAEIARAVQTEYQPAQTELAIDVRYPDIAAVVAKTVTAVERGTIDIPRILVVPKGDVRAHFEPFTLDLSGLRYTPVSEDLYIQHLRTGKVDELSVSGGGVEERRLEDYVVGGLIAFDDVSYDDNAELLYDLAGQVVRHLMRYLSEEDTRRVLRYHQREIARFVHAQMQPHFREEASGGYEVVVSRGFSPLKQSAYTAAVSGGVCDYRFSPADKANIAKYLFGGFLKCLYDVQKFQSDPERVMALVLERDAEKWMRPAKGQFQMYYRSGSNQAEYQPDFVAETADAVLMVEVKARNTLDDADVLAKCATGRQWCERATAFLTQHGGKSWRYVLIPHDSILLNSSLASLVRRFGQ
jgi:type III restriction enzyme